MDRLAYCGLRGGTDPAADTRAALAGAIRARVHDADDRARHFWCGGRRDGRGVGVGILDRPCGDVVHCVELRSDGGRLSVSGSAYTYVRRSIDSRVGFLTGWAVLLDYLFLPMVIWLIGAAYLEAQFPAVPGWLWIIGFIVVTTVLNVVGIKVADKANYLLMAFQLLVLVMFVALSVGHVVTSNGVGFLSPPPPPRSTQNTTVDNPGAGPRNRKPVPCMRGDAGGPGIDGTQPGSSARR